MSFLFLEFGCLLYLEGHYYLNIIKVKVNYINVHWKPSVIDEMKNLYLSYDVACISCTGNGTCETGHNKVNTLST